MTAQKGNDGAVECSIAHIDEAESERVIQPSSQATQGDAKTIEEARRIRLRTGGGDRDRPRRAVPVAQFPSTQISAL